MEFTYVITEGSQLTVNITLTHSLDMLIFLSIIDFHQVFKGPLPQINHVLIKTLLFNLLSLLKASCFAILHNSMQFAK